MIKNAMISAYKLKKKMRSSYKIVILTLLGVLFFTPVVLASDSIQAKNVLILFTFESGLPANDLIYKNLRATLDSQVDEPVNYYIEYLDRSRFPDEEYQRQLFDLYKKKYSGKKIDVFIPIGQGTELILEKYGKQTFAGLPTLFIEVQSSPHYEPPFYRNSHATGILIDLKLENNLETAMLLSPAATDIYVVSGASPLDQFFESLVRDAYRRYEDTFKISYLNGLPMDELLQTVADLSQNSIIIYFSYHKDNSGRVYYPAHALKLITDRANAPVYGIFDTYLGHGIVGGYVISFERVGVEVGKMALRVLRGEAPETIPIVREGINLYMFDQRQLKRWKISENRLPKESQVRFYEPNFRQVYRGYILGILLIFMVEGLLITKLLFERRCKRIAQQKLEAQLRFEEMIGEISANFINLPPDLIDGYIVEAMEKISKFFGFDIAELGLFTGLTQKEIKSHLWITPHESASYSGMNYENFPWTLSKINDGQSVCFQNAIRLPAEAQTDRMICETIPIRSLYVLPLFSGTSNIGFFTLSTWSESVKMTSAMLQQQKILAEVLANAVVRRDTWQLLQESEERMSMAASSAELALWVWDINKDEVWMTEKGRAMFGYSDSEPIGSQQFLETAAGADCKSIPRFLERAMKSGYNHETEHRITLPSGDIRWIVTRSRVDVDENKQPQRMLGVSADISLRKKAEEEVAKLSSELARYSRINMLGELSGSLAHELNQPLAAILTSAQAGLRFLRSGKADSELLGQILQNIVEDDKRAAEVITSLRSMVKKEKNKKEPVNLNDIINDALLIFKSEAFALNLKMETDLDKSLPACSGDKIQLRQVMLNLIMNGADAMISTFPENKKMVLQTKVTEHGVQASVRDFGSGISDINHNQIFEWFFTTKNTGLGMGLALCKTIIENHGGRIWGENNPNSGATFFLELPVMKND